MTCTRLLRGDASAWRRRARVNIHLLVALSGMDRREPYPADKARGAYIELRRPWQRYVFIGGLAGIVVLLLVLRILAG